LVLELQHTAIHRQARLPAGVDHGECAAEGALCEGYESVSFSLPSSSILSPLAMGSGEEVYSMRCWMWDVARDVLSISLAHFARTFL
jgi:hypothetical protein